MTEGKTGGGRTFMASVDHSFAPYFLISCLSSSSSCLVHGCLLPSERCSSSMRSWASSDISLITSSHSIMSAWSMHRSRYVRCARAGQHQQADGRRQTARLRQRPVGQLPAGQRERCWED